MSATTTKEQELLPDRQLLAWLRGAHALEDAEITGESLPFVAAAHQTLVLRLKPEPFAGLRAEAREGDLRLPGLLASHESEAEVRLEIDTEDESKHTLLVRPYMPEPAPAHTIDELVFDRVHNAWEGSEAGREDLAARVLRASVEDASGPSFTLRTVARAALLDFEIEPALLARLKSAYRPEDMESLPRRFLRRQFRYILTGRKPSRAFLYLDELGMLDWFLPELAAARGLTQNRYHKHDIFLHSIYTCDAVPGPDLVLRLAGLMHDFGKVDTRREKPNGEATFHNHEVISARHVDRVLRRFGFDSALIKRVRFLVRNHMFHYTAEWTDRAIRRFMRKVPIDRLNDLISLRLADRKGSGKRQALPRAIKDLIRHMDEVRAREAELKVSDLAIDGHALMELGMPAGPRMGELLRALLEEVRTNAVQNEREALIERARWLMASRNLESMHGK
ncbi:MAG: HD domain-containing protein [Spirochaetales bacterium]|nr:HD domain-containing protein [Leptospiraceae bacterium]MCP5481202.1 HD domain-containing protein [Spirochaetales bacterium]